MKASYFAETIAGIGCFVGAIVAIAGLYPIGLIIGLASIIWFITKGQNLKGWVGQSYPELEAEKRRLNSLMEEWKYPDGTDVPPRKRKEVLKRVGRVTQQLEEHPDNPNKRHY